MSSHIDQWGTSLNSDCGVNGAGNLEHIGYLRMIMIMNYTVSCSCRNAIGLLYQNLDGERVAPLRIETGRYVNLPVSERICPFCNDWVETEMHGLLKCPLYSQIREVL